MGTREIQWHLPALIVGIMRLVLGGGVAISAATSFAPANFALSGNMVLTVAMTHGAAIIGILWNIGKLFDESL